MLDLLTVLLLMVLFLVSYVFSLHYLKEEKPQQRKYALLLLLTALVLLGISFSAQGLRERAFPLFTFRSTLQFLMLIFVAINVAFLASTGIFVVNRYSIPVFMAIALLSLYAEQSTKSAEAQLYLTEPLAIIHIAWFILAYGLFLLAAFLALVYLSLDYKIKRKMAQEELQGYPALEQTQFFANQFVWVGLVCLSLGILTGALFARSQPQTLTASDPKVISSILSWTYYVIYVGFRHRAGWVGRRACYLIIAGCIMVFMAYVIANVFIATRMHGYV